MKMREFVEIVFIKFELKLLSNAFSLLTLVRNKLVHLYLKNEIKVSKGESVQNKYPFNIMRVARIFLKVCFQNIQMLAMLYLYEL